MKRITALILLLATSLIIGCSSTPPKGLESSVGQQLYTQVGFWTYKNQHETVNYGVNRFIPVNTQVNINDINAKVVEFTLSDNGAERVLINTEKYTHQEMGEIFFRYFGKKKVDLQGFSSAERKAIERGEVKKGMSKKAVLLARGYPPAHETHSTDDNEWKYWNSRFNTMIVYFKDDKVSRIRN
ncbi:hypothetical protein [Gilvimarinus polysaccharolyticus]|uniref:hypothetical protein n=1 Tax=Gilvimarinus polysaccharolyticus TaxID=863921 RepID=UPI0006733C2B|nr:hypothetical protein [Gilvimarinus polysaccharolyticus]